LPPLLSIVIPAHNEEGRLPDTLTQVWTFLHEQNFESEIVIVENGSSDGTLKLARDFASSHPGVLVLEEPRAGKGLAVRRGMLEARGDYRFICDADLSMPIEEVLRFLPPLAPPYDVAIASREVAGAQRFGEPAYRHFVGRIFNFMVRMITLPGIQDTQCGFKCFRARAAADLFRVQTIDGWTFDVELLYVALQRGYQVAEIPIPWYYRAGSRVRIFSDSLHMLADLFRIRYNDLRGRYARRT
jgi:dolichyl-phosphate beta-glucosyltransferase